MVWSHQVHPDGHERLSGSQASSYAVPTATARHLASSILVVDADDDTRALYRQAFSPFGGECVEASDGRDALRKALVQPPTLVVTEITLPIRAVRRKCVNENSAGSR